MPTDAELISLLPFALALLGTGAAAGVLAGLLGVGGGIVIVPILYLIFPAFDVPETVRMHLAVGTSLATIVPTGLVSAQSHWKRGGVDVPIVRQIGPWIVLGVGIGIAVGTNVGSDILKSVFAGVALLVALHMGLGRDGWTIAGTLPRWPGRALIGCWIGGFSVVMGIGGGTLGVPTLSAFGVPIRRAVGTAAAFGPVIALPGVIGFVVSGFGHPDLPAFSLGYANLLAFAVIVPATIAFAPLGAKLAHTINPTLLRRAFAAFLFLTACRMGWAAFFG